MSFLFLAAAAEDHSNLFSIVCLPGKVDYLSFHVKLPSSRHAFAPLPPGGVIAQPL
jgi:hypothetical protein